MFENSTLIVAHPDDDILWLSSVFDKVGSIVFCFNNSPRDPEAGAARKKTIAEYPLANVSTLDLTETQSFNKADWTRPVTTVYGLRLDRSHETDSVYRKTYEELLAALRALVTDRKNVFTHNPWGEYGHEDHVLVYRVLKKLQAEFNYKLWFSNYCSDRSVILMNKCIPGLSSDYRRLPANVALAQEIAGIYRKNGCWTWYEDYRWFDHEYLMSEELSTGQPETLAGAHSFPINYIKMDILPGRPQPHPLSRMVKRIRRKLGSAL